jgi:hypothetical protein
LSCDPAGPVDGPNLYVYAQSSPLIYTDPSGNQSPYEMYLEMHKKSRDPNLPLKTRVLAGFGAGCLLWSGLAPIDYAFTTTVRVAGPLLDQLEPVFHAMSQVPHTGSMGRMGLVLHRYSRMLRGLRGSRHFLRRGASVARSRPSRVLKSRGARRPSRVNTRTASRVAPSARSISSKALREKFMRAQLKVVSQKGHPLNFLVDPATKSWKARTHLSQRPTVQAGHLTSRHSGAVERFALEDSYFNQVSNWLGEMQGAIFEKSAISIGGVPVELRTAQMWERLGKLPTGTVKHAPRHSGWTK